VIGNESTKPLQSRVGTPDPYARADLNLAPPAAVARATFLDWVRQYPIWLIEDGLAEDDWDAGAS
jgi:hypothetical protein